MLSLWKLTGKIKPGLSFLHNLQEMMEPEKAFIKLILINSMAISFLSLILPVSIQSVITNLGILNVTQPIVILTIVLFIILLFSGGLQVLQFHTIEYLRRRLFLRFGKVLLEKLTHYDETAFRRIHQTSLMKRAFDILLAQNSMVIFFVDGIGFTLQYLMALLLLCVYHPYFLVFAIFISIVIWLSWQLFGPQGVAAGTPEADTRYDVLSWLDEILRCRPQFMTSNVQLFAEKKMVELFGTWNHKRENLFRQQLIQNVSLQLINAFVYATLLGIGYFLVKAGELSIGQLVAAFIVVTMLLSSLPRLQNFYISIYDFSTNLDKLAEFYDHPLESLPLKTTQNPQRPWTIEVQNAQFEDNIFLDLTIQPRSKIYLYTQSYAAARTLQETLEGLRAPMIGDIKFNQQRLSDLSFNHLRNHVAVIAQGRIFSGSILENLTCFSRDQFTLSECENALEKVDLLAKVRALPEGLQTQIMPSGYPFTLSELMAMQIARILIQKPELIIVTNDFDKISHERRRVARQLLLDSNASWSVLFFSHRFVAGPFDKYYVLERQKLTPIQNENDIRRVVENDEK
jgi:putative ABC transport system ATP-binding protein